MTTSLCYLDKQITVETLRTEADASGRFSGGDDRGRVAMIIAGEKVDYVEYAEFSNAGIKRGFHFHKEYHERLYIISGRITVAALRITSGEKILFNAQSGCLITIAPGIAHAFLSLETSCVLSMGTGAHPFQDRHIYTDLSFGSST